jgi:hypothetical protein
VPCGLVDNLTVLGINFDVDISKITKINYEKYSKKMKGLFKKWNKRNLTPIGKITVVKSLILPVLLHDILFHSINR